MTHVHVEVARNIRIVVENKENPPQKGGFFISFFMYNTGINN